MCQDRRDDVEKNMEQMIGNLLRVGVLVSASVVAVGALVYLVRHGREPVNFRAFIGEPQDLRSPIGIVRAALSLRGRGLIQLGVLLLIATPVARVVLSVV